MAEILAVKTSPRGCAEPITVAAAIDGEYLSLRWVIAHATGEATRHAGHADILRELIDGTTGR